MALLFAGNCDNEDHYEHRGVMWAQAHLYAEWHTDCPSVDEPGSGWVEAEGPGDWEIEETSAGQAEAWRNCNTMMAEHMDCPTPCYHCTPGHADAEYWDDHASAVDDVYNGDKAKMWGNVQAKVIGGGWQDEGEAEATHTVLLSEWTSSVEAP